MKVDCDECIVTAAESHCQSSVAALKEDGASIAFSVKELCYNNENDDFTSFENALVACGCNDNVL